MKAILLAGLLLAGLSGCSKNSSDPSPTPKLNTATLEARWQVDSTWVTATPAAPKISISVAPSGSAIEFTATEYLSWLGNTLGPRYTYMRVGNTITFTNNGNSIANERAIIQLTPNRLVLRHIQDGYPASTQIRATTTYHR